MTMLSSRIITRCRELASESRTKYISDHGKDPSPESVGGSLPEIEGYFTADFRRLCQQGAQEVDRAECCEIWEQSFFQLVPAAGNEGGS
jgi:hypothetical protein